MLIGYTTGTYDLFHQGHVEFLRRARALCDKLIVGVTQDELGYQEKGRRPVLGLEERMSVVGACRYVDVVVEHGDRGGDKLEPWKKFHFDIVFIGDDWKDHPTYTELPNKIPVRVIFLPYTQTISTTKIRQKLNIGT